MAGAYRRRAQLGSRVLIGGFGPLNKPNIPKLPGLERFAGPAFHSSAWDHTVDLTGKNVAVIGTGASAIQFVPRIVPQAGRVFVFQRTAPWIIKKPDGPLSATHRRLRRIAPLAWLERKLVYWVQESLAYGFTVNPKALGKLEQRALRYLEKTVRDPELRRKLVPTFRIGCKRILFSYDYLPALVQPNVEVVTSGIREVRERSVIDDDGVERPVDVIVFGTGFRATEGVAPVKIYGTGGVELNDAWRNGIEAYLGTSVAGLSELFLDRRAEHGARSQLDRADDRSAGAVHHERAAAHAEEERSRARRPARRADRLQPPHSR